MNKLNQLWTKFRALPPKTQKIVGVVVGFFTIVAILKIVG